MQFQIEIENGKYTYFFDNGNQYVFRYGEKWRDLLGNKFVYLLANEVNDSRREASAIAMNMWETFYKTDSPQFELLTEAPGILSQIDNMYTGIREDLLKKNIQVERMRELLVRIRRDLMIRAEPDYDNPRSIKVVNLSASIWEDLLFELTPNPEG